MEVNIGWRRRLAGAALVAAVAFAAGPASVHAAEPEWNVARVGGPLPAAGATIAIVDTGVDASHPTFGGRVLPAIDLAGGSGGDPHGHGTHVAGIAGGGAAGPIIGVAPGVQILPVRVLGTDGTGEMKTVAEGIRKAADAGAAVINLSLSDGVFIRSIFGSALSDAIHYAWAKGAICVLAAGNEGDGLFGLLFGSGYHDLPAVIVTATGSDDRKAGYANGIGGARWGMSAPGEALSSFPSGQYGQMSGTSMAAPHVSGALAVLRAHGLGAQQAIDRLLTTARPLGARSTYGAGMVDLAAATQGMAINAGGPPPPPPAAPPPPTPTEPEPAAAPDTSSSQPSSSRPTTSVAPTSAVPDTSAPSSDVVLPSTERQAAAPVLPQNDTDSNDAVPLPVTLAAAIAAGVVWVAAVRQLRSTARISLGRM